MPPFMSTAPRPCSTPSATSPENGAVAPGALVARRHDVGVAGEGEVRPVGADAGVEIVDVGGAGLAEGHAVAGEAAAFRALKHAQRTGIGRRDPGAADEIAGNRESIGHARPINPAAAR